MKLNFVIGIGAQKSASTWLGDYFANHPDICFSPRKEMHYFDSKYLDIYRTYAETRLNGLKRIVKNFDLENPAPAQIKRMRFLVDRLEMEHDPKAYVRYFSRIHNGEKYCSEITPTYSLLDEDGFAAMNALLPNVKIIMLMRNPIDRHWSHLRFKAMKNKGFNHQNNFEKSFESKHFFEAGNYKRTFENVYKVFSKEQVYPLFYEHLFDPEKQESHFDGLLEFLAIEKRKPKFKTKSNASTSEAITEEQRKYAYQRLQDIYQYIQQEFADIPDSWLSDMEKYS